MSKLDQTLNPHDSLIINMAKKNSRNSKSYKLTDKLHVVITISDLFYLCRLIHLEQEVMMDSEQWTKSP